MNDDQYVIGKMTITRQSPLTGLWNSMEIEVTTEQLDEFQKPGRRLIQEIFPQLSATQREFIKSGYTIDDWAAMFPPEEDEGEN